jgi:predicted RNA-binding Zn ribbon-like protein
MGKAFRARLENEVLPRLTNPENQRSAVAVRIMSIVDRQIGQGDHEARKEWDHLRDFVKSQPAAVAMVETLQEAVNKYDDDLTKQIAAGADEAKVRRSAAGLINMAVMQKVKGPPKDSAAEPAAPEGDAAEKAPAKTEA